MRLGAASLVLLLIPACGGPAAVDDGAGDPGGRAAGGGLAAAGGAGGAPAGAGGSAGAGEGGAGAGGGGAAGEAGSAAGGAGGAGLPAGPCTVTPSPAAFERPVRELHWGRTGMRPALFPDHDQVIVSPVVLNLTDDDGDGDVDLDDVPDLAFVSYQTFDQPGVLRVVSGRAPYTEHFSVAGPADVPALRFDGHLAAGDLDGDGRPEIVTTRHGGGLVAFRNDGTLLWESSEPAAAETQPNGSIALADLDGDGRAEIVVGRVVVSSEGRLLWRGTGGAGKNGQGPLSCVADVVPGSPGPEVIAGRTVYSAGGQELWSAAGEGDGFCAVADLFDAAGGRAADGEPEVVRVAAGRLVVHDGASGRVLLDLALPGGGNGGAPTVADFDGDGRAEVGVAGATRYAVFDPDCADATGGCQGAGIRWQVPTEDDSSNVTSSTVFDFNGDGRAEVVYNDEQYFRVYDGSTGDVLFEEPNPSRTRTEQPVVADVDGDGNAEIVFSANDEASFAGDRLAAAERVPGLEIWSSADDSWVPARRIWNQHTYHVTNVEEDGRIPRVEAASWREVNSYRRNTAGSDALAAPDLVPAGEPGDGVSCTAGRPFELCALVTNRGDLLVGPGLEVAFSAGEPPAVVARGRTALVLQPGASERVCASWDAPPPGRSVVRVTVDAAAGARECREDNNELELVELECFTAPG